MAIPSRPMLRALPLLMLFGFLYQALAMDEARLGSIRVVFQLRYGDIEFGFYPEVAPKTVAHILKLVQLGGYNSNHFFRVDKGFVAQVADVVGGRAAPLNREQREEGVKTVPGEFSKVRHVRGILSMGRYDDPDSATSSFSILLGSAPHLDGQYAVFGKVTKGYDTLAILEELPTRKEGIFVMPLERISIMSTYYYDLADMVGGSTCEDELAVVKRKFAQATDFIDQQHTSVSPDGKQVMVVGDNVDGILADSQTGKAIGKLIGHLDYSFASS